MIYVRVNCVPSTLKGQGNNVIDNNKLVMSPVIDFELKGETRTVTIICAINNFSFYCFSKLIYLYFMEIENLVSEIYIYIYSKM